MQNLNSSLVANGNENQTETATPSAGKKRSVTSSFVSWLKLVAVSIILAPIAAAIIAVISTFSALVSYALAALFSASMFFVIVRPLRGTLLASRTANIIYLVHALVSFVLIAQFSERNQLRQALLEEVAQSTEVTDAKIEEWLVRAVEIDGGQESDTYQAVFRVTRPDEYLDDLLERSGLSEFYLKEVSALAPEKWFAEKERFDKAQAEKEAARQRALEVEAQAKEAEKQREAAAKQATEAEERRKGFHCLSSWDGSHRELKKAVKAALRNPDSFEHIQTLITPRTANGQHRVTMEYRAQNGFGGMNVEYQVAMISGDTCGIVSFH
ncbi:cell envelope integrity protein TolA [Ruegeria sp. SCPT10]|uniref:cell envelope integrity protein TolA n=1 Tax=Ruegeria sp. SCP10 TaxID=3141377 RepID=UPI00333C1216